MTTYWNVVQACVWIAMHDEALIASIRPGSNVLEAGYLAAETPSLGDATEDPDELRRDSVFRAQQDLRDACSNGELEMLGRVRGVGNMAPIPKLAWSKLVIRYEESHGTIAASPDLIDSVATWWDELCLDEDQVRAKWPAPVMEQGAPALPQDWPIEADAVIARALRIRCRTSVQEQPLASDGLADRGVSTLTEAVSWLALRRSIPHRTWAAYASLRDARVEHARARRDFLGAMRRSQAYAWPSVPTLETFRGTLEDDLADTPTRISHTGRALAESVAAATEIRQAFYAARPAETPLSKPGFQAALRGALHEAQRALFTKFGGGKLHCEGLNGTKATDWTTVPASLFRRQICVDLSHNVLEPAPPAGDDEVDRLRTLLSVWVDLQIDSKALEKEFPAMLATGESSSETVGTGEPPPSTNATSTKAVLDNEFRRYAEAEHAAGNIIVVGKAWTAMKAWAATQAGAPRVTRKRIRVLVETLDIDWRSKRSRPPNGGKLPVKVAKVSRRK